MNITEIEPAHSDRNAPKRLVIGDLAVTRLSRTEFAERMVQDWGMQRTSSFSLRAKLSFSVNGQIVAEVNRNPRMKEVFAKADYLDADGMWLVFASRLLCDEPLAERVATTDFFHDAAVEAQRAGISFYILGSTERNNTEACAAIRKLYPSLKIVGAQHGYFSAEQEDDVCKEIAAARPDVVWIAMGYPRQEVFAERLKSHLVGTTWIKTCGGLLEHILELKPRAPLILQKLGLEWLHRLLQEPKRLGMRYVKTNPLAMWDLATKTRRAALEKHDVR